MRFVLIVLLKSFQVISLSRLDRAIGVLYVGSEYLVCSCVVVIQVL